MPHTSSDKLQTFLFEDTDIRGAIVTLDASLDDLFAGKSMEPTRESLLGEFAAANILLSSHIKFTGRLSLQARKGKAASLVMSECTDSLDFRGIVESDEILHGMDFGDILEGGILTITISPDKGQQYQGVVPLESDSLAACLCDYFRQSEQIPSWFSFYQKEGTVTALMLQALPEKHCHDTDQRQEDWSRLTHLASTLTADEATGLPHEELLFRLYHEETVRLFDPHTTRFKCSCSRERMERNLISLGEAELHDILEQEEIIETTCHFCHAQYVFSQQDIQQLLAGSSGKMH